MNRQSNRTPFSADESHGVETANLLHQLEPSRTVGTVNRAGCESWSCAWSSDNSYFAWSCGNNIVKLLPWNRQKHCLFNFNSSDDDFDRQLEETREYILNAGQLVWAVAFGSREPHSQYRSTCLNWSQKVVEAVLAAGLQNGCIKTWNVKTGQPLHELSDHTEVVRDLRFAPDGSLLLASASRDGTLRVWQLGDSNGSRQHTSRVLHGIESKWLYACCWSPDARTVVACGKTGSVTLWDMTTYRVKRHLSGHQLDVCGCDFSPDGALLVTSSYDASVIVWDPHVGTMLLQLSHKVSALPVEVNETYVRGVSFSHDGRHVASVSDDGPLCSGIDCHLLVQDMNRFLRFWDIYNPQMPCQSAVVSNALCCRYSPDGAVLSVGTRNGNATIWLAPMKAPSLQHVCRLAIRRILPTEGINLLQMPDRLKRFLRYEVHW